LGMIAKFAEKAGMLAEDVLLIPIAALERAAAGPDIGWSALDVARLLALCAMQLQRWMQPMVARRL
jgi:hypothetical protein